jgi:hypothetical protein
MTTIKTFLDRKTHIKNEHGFAPVWMPDLLFPFQQSLTEWAIQKAAPPYSPIVVWAKP